MSLTAWRQKRAVRFSYKTQIVNYGQQIQVRRQLAIRVSSFLHLITLINKHESICNRNRFSPPDQCIQWMGISEPQLSMRAGT